MLELHEEALGEKPSHPWSQVAQAPADLRAITDESTWVTIGKINRRTTQLSPARLQNYEPKNIHWFKPVGFGWFFYIAAGVIME